MKQSRLRTQDIAGLEAALARGRERIECANRYPMRLIPMKGMMGVFIYDRPYVMTLGELRQLRELADEGIRRLST